MQKKLSVTRRNTAALTGSLSSDSPSPTSNPTREALETLSSVHSTEDEKKAAAIKLNAFSLVLRAGFKAKQPVDREAILNSTAMLMDIILKAGKKSKITRPILRCLNNIATTRERDEIIRKKGTISFFIQMLKTKQKDLIRISAEQLYSMSYNKTHRGAMRTEEQLTTLVEFMNRNFNSRNSRTEWLTPVECIAHTLIHLSFEESNQRHMIADAGATTLFVNALASQNSQEVNMGIRGTYNLLRRGWTGWLQLCRCNNAVENTLQNIKRTQDGIIDALEKKEHMGLFALIQLQRQTEDTELSDNAERTIATLLDIRPELEAVTQRLETLSSSDQDLKMKAFRKHIDSQKTDTKKKEKKIEGTKQKKTNTKKGHKTRKTQVHPSR